MNILLADLDLLVLAKDFGIPLCLVLFFVVETKRREDRMAARLDKVEDYGRTELVRVVEKNTAVMVRLEEWLDQQTVTPSQNPTRRKPRTDHDIPHRKD